SVKVIAGGFGGARAPPPNAVSWAADPGHNVRILLIKASPGAEVALPAVSPTANRNLYFVEGGSVVIGGIEYEASMRLKLRGGEDVTFANGGSDGTYWLLEGEPIGERMSSFGPVILGSDKEVRAAMNHIRENEYGSWPWDLVDKFHPKGTGRFARFSDGREESPPL
ncbi:MAG: pirin family protein, partial [Methanomassiliicoccaceae archaeon]|nr:pirin family protein [Methanomassiliicoccaceae archaeon]